MSSDGGVTSTINRQTQDYLTRAKLYGQVIRCTTPIGVEFDFLPYITECNAGTIWLSARRDVSDPSHITTETSVRNFVRMCRPDVELLHERDSAFCGDGDFNGE